MRTRWCVRGAAQAAAQVTALEFRENGGVRPLQADMSGVEVRVGERDGSMQECVKSVSQTVHSAIKASAGSLYTLSSVDEQAEDFLCR